MIEGTRYYNSIASASICRMGIGDVLLKESFSDPFKHRSISEYRFSEIRLHVEFHFRSLTLQKHSYCEKFCQSTPIDFWSNILSVNSRNWTCQQTSKGGMVLVLYVPPLLPLNHSRLLDPPKSTLLTIGRKTTRVRIQILSIDGRSYGQMLIY